MWALKLGLKDVRLSIDPARSVLVAQSPETDKQHETKIDLDLDVVRKKTTEDYRTVVAVHEAGHALVQAILFKNAPEEIKINASSFADGYVIPEIDLLKRAHSRRDMKHRLAVLYAGRCAEALVFGPDFITLGAESDIAKATQLAVQYVRTSALDGVPGLQMYPEYGRNIKTLLPSAAADEPIEQLLVEAKERATQELVQHKPLFVKLVSALVEGKTINKEQFIQLFPELCLKPEPIYSELWRNFKS